MIPAYIVAILRDPPPTTADFTPTKFTPSDTKLWFTTHFIRFASSDFPKHQFTHRFYRQVMHTFGFIAHYDLDGFWTEYFTSTAGKIEFLEQVISWPCHGDATHTFCHAEREIARRLKAADLVGLYRAQLKNEEHAHERAELARLKAKYESLPGPIPVTSAPSSPRHPTAQPAMTDRTQLAFALG